ncbi:hypothetical protein Tco_0534183 [Tanacetum coccineum]
MELVTKLSDRVVAVEEDLKQTKKTYSTALTKLVLKVKKLEKQVRMKELHEKTPTELIEDLGSGEKGKKEISTIDVPVSTAGAEVQYCQQDVSTAVCQALCELQERFKRRKGTSKSNVEPRKEMDYLKLPPELPKHRMKGKKFQKNMVMYLKNQAGYKQSYFKGMKYEEIRPIFEKVWDQTHTFVPMDSEDKEKGSKKKAGGSRKKTLAKKRAGEKQSDQSAKRQKTEYDSEKEELKAYLDIVPG